MDMAEAATPHNSLDESALVYQISQGDREAFNLLFERYQLAIYRYCRFMVDDFALAEDIYQETFLSFYNVCHQGKDVHNVRGYLFAIARSKCLDFLENKKKYVPLEEASELHYQFDESSKDTMEHFYKAVSRLPEQYRETFVLFSIKQYSYDEIAGMLNISKNVVKNRVFRAKQGLQKVLSPILRDKEG